MPARRSNDRIQFPRFVKRPIFVFALVLLCAYTAAVAFGRGPGAIVGLQFVSEYNIPPGGRFPVGTDLRFGGISGLSSIGAGNQVFGISDDRDAPHVYRFAIGVRSDRLTVTPVEAIRLTPDRRAPAMLDPEGIA